MTETCEVCHTDCSKGGTQADCDGNLLPTPKEVSSGMWELAAEAICKEFGPAAEGAVEFNDSPSEALFIVTIYVSDGPEARKLLQFAKDNGIGGF